MIIHANATTPMTAVVQSRSNASAAVALARRVLPAPKARSVQEALPVLKAFPELEVRLGPKALKG